MIHIQYCGPVPDPTPLMAIIAVDKVGKNFLPTQPGGVRALNLNYNM